MRIIGTPSESSVTRQEVLHLTVPQLLDLRVVCRPFDPAIPAAVVVGAVPILLAVGFVVLVVVRNEVVQREPVVAGDEIHAGFGFTPFVAVHRRGSPACSPRALATLPSSPRKKLRTSSRKRPFHSFQASPMKVPT